MARLVVWLKEEKNFLYRVQSPAEKDIVVWPNFDNIYKSDFLLVSGNQLQLLLFGGRLLPVSLRFHFEQWVGQFQQIGQVVLEKINEKTARKLEIACCKRRQTLCRNGVGTTKRPVSRKSVLQ